MVANLSNTRIPPTATKRFGWCRPALNPPKDVFSIRLRPSGPKGLYTVLKAVNMRRRLHVCRRKCSINPPLSPLASLLPPPGRHVRSRPSSRSFFILRSRLLLALGPAQIFVKKNLDRTSLYKLLERRTNQFIDPTRTFVLSRAIFEDIF
jgi:hypothetical protein